jgi:hypothetical protein
MCLKILWKLQKSCMSFEYLTEVKTNFTEIWNADVQEKKPAAFICRV